MFWSGRGEAQYPNTGDFPVKDYQRLLRE